MGGPVPCCRPTLWLCVLLIFTCTHVISAEATTDVQDGPIVNTKYGSVQGNRKTDPYSGKVYEEYLGIPFATPPVGVKRWKKPEPPSAWNGTRDATVHGSHCTHIIALIYEFINMTSETSEDCLYLNVYVPGKVAPDRKLPVMVWIYGGGFIMGTAEMYPGMQLALHGDVIVVTINYRMNVIGFLSTGDKIAPGNYGFWDMNRALRWVNGNIANFGGDASQVTIFGESAGSSATSANFVSPQSKGLIARAIEQSGSSLGYRPATESNRDAIRSLASWFLCDWSDDLNDMIECLRDEDALDIDIWSFVDTGMNGAVHHAVVDGEFLPKSPADLYKAGAVKDMPLMTGLNYHDGAGFVFLNPIGLKLDGLLNIAADKEAFHALLNEALGNASFAELKTLYPDVESDNYTTRTKAAAHILTDGTFGSSSHLESKLHSRFAAGKDNTFKYIFRYRQSFLQYLPWVNGSHFDEIYSVLGPIFMETYRKAYLDKSEFSQDDLKMMNTVMTYWTNFAKTGDPNKGKPVQVVWPGYIEGINQYMELTRSMSSDSSRVENEEMLKKYQFWIDIKYKGRKKNIAESIWHSTAENEKKTGPFTIDDIEKAENWAKGMVDRLASSLPRRSNVVNKLAENISRVASRLRAKRLRVCTMEDNLFDCRSYVTSRKLYWKEYGLP